ncbi:methyl-accepting chemotaxis protein [Natrinema salifodinae]|uniref:Methyl-accepting chemotaxis protein n=1 Tax=Natrinema salifodinae TaxID=1202768 RepID=A0A1I0QCV8_9EURY|nr:methyl-accepting chemotaxis protein [Natrinema salifodinae]SEW24888.1 methyl-accepting chemotaxis protein [Natrinema salifodinae]
MHLDPWERVPAIRRSYALRFVAALAIVLLVVGLFGGSIYAQTGDQLQDDVESQLVTDAQKDANRLDIWFRSTERYLGSLPRSVAFRNDDRVAIADSLHRVTDRTAFEGAYYVDTETGDVDANAGATAVIDDGRMNDAVDERFATALEDDSQVVFSEPFETDDGRPAMLAVSGVPGESDHAVVGLVDLASLSRYMIGADETHDVRVVDESGTVVLAEDQSLLLQRDVLDSGAVADGTGTASIAPDETNGGDDETVVGYAALSHEGWTLTTRVPASQAYSLQTSISTQLLAMLAVVFASLVVLGATIGRTTAGSLRELSERAAAIENGDLDEPLESDRSDELGDLYRSIDRMRRSLRDRLEETEAARAEAERARAESEAFSERLERTADEYGETMRACADGDLTQRLDPDGESEAMATVAAEFNAMMDDIEATVAATRTFADAVDRAATSTADGVVEVRTASDQVTTSVQQIADGAERQSDQLAAITGEIDDLSTTTEEIAASASQVATLAERTAETSAAARESAQQAITGMNAIEEEATAAVAEVDRLEAEIEAIDDLLEFIGQVTTETNMLALNASIEAARSDSDDAEFSAVADQVKSLAADTKEAATDVEDRLERVGRQTDRVATVVRETDERIATHRSAVEASVSSLEEISEFAAETNDGVQEISAATQQQAGATQEVATMTDDVTAISEETSAEAETVAAAAEEQTSSLVEVSRSATSLSDQAKELADALAAFEVSADPDGDDPGAALSAIETETGTNGETDAAPAAEGEDEGDTVRTGTDGTTAGRKFDWQEPQ